MRKWFYIMGSLIILGHLASEAHSIALFFFPNIPKVYVEKWLHIKMPHDEHLNLQWFLAIAGQDFMICCYILVAAMQAWCYEYKSYLQWKPYSKRLFQMWGIYLLYHLIDSGMLYVNFKQGYAWYWALLGLTTAGMICLMWPIKVKDIQNVHYIE